jgi:hypothetical protein
MERSPRTNSKIADSHCMLDSGKLQYPIRTYLFDVVQDQQYACVTGVAFWGLPLLTTLIGLGLERVGYFFAVRTVHPVERPLA